VDAVIQCRNLRKTYDGKVEAVRGLSLEIRGGECFGLLGPNGAGKTTTIEILEGLLEPTSGEVRILGHTWQENAPELREWLGISLQETRLSEKLTVRETVELFASFFRQPRSSDEVMEEMQLSEKADSWVGKLSGGQKGGTVLLTTHYMDEAERLCDRLSIVDHGQIIAEGPPDDLITRLGGHHVVEFEASLANGNLLDTWRALPGVEGVRDEDGLVCLNVREPHLTIPALLDTVRDQGSELLHLTTRQASLEDVFVRLTGRHLRED
jgi:ABC-2 type transport system ATP-binding protein